MSTFAYVLVTTIECLFLTTVGCQLVTIQSVETAYLRERLTCAVVPCFDHRLHARMSLVGQGGSIGDYHCVYR